MFGSKLQQAAKTATPGAAAHFHSSSRMAAPAPVKLIPVSVNGKWVDVPAGSTALAACEIAGIHLPRFCYHERLSIAGNCRMCLISVDKMAKPIAACAMPVMPKMKLFTDTPAVKKYREGVMEFLLANHPLDCPICDQGGECDLQDQSWVYGSDRSRFREVKRSVEDKNLGPLVKTVMTRCIHCTRCVRYASEVCGTPILGTTGRGGSVEIGTYTGQLFDSEVSGNVIDLCPVGALTSKPFAFTARPWDLTGTETIDVTDAIGSNIRVDIRGAEIMRILPRLNEQVNEEWISDKARFSYDGLKRQRLDVPLLKKGNEYLPITWAEAFQIIKEKTQGIRGYDMLALAGDDADAESIICLKDLMNRLGSSNTAPAQSDVSLSVDVRSDYLFNSRLAGVEEADMILLVGTNPRMEAAVLTARMRKVVRSNDVLVVSIGPEMDLALQHKHLGNDSTILSDVASGKHAFANVFKQAKRPMVVVGMGAVRDLGHESLKNTLNQLCQQVPNLRTNDWNGVNFLQTSAGRVAMQDLGFVPGANASTQPAKFVYLLNADNFDESKIASDAFVVYQGHHGDAGASRADIVLPGSAYTEKSATYVNTEGRVQKTTAALPALAQAREDWAVIRALSEVLGKPLPYNRLQDVRNRLKDVAPHFGRVDNVEAASYLGSVEPKSDSQLKKTSLSPYITNFFNTDPVTRSSKVMAKCASTLKVARNSYKTA